MKNNIFDKEVSLDDLYKLGALKKDKDSELPTPISDPPEDVKELEDFCKKMGIVGVGTTARGFGISAKSMLNMLKQKIGFIEDDKQNKKRTLLNG